MTSAVEFDPATGVYRVRLRCDCGAGCDLRVARLDEARAKLRGAGWTIEDTLCVFACPACAATATPRQ